MKKGLTILAIATIVLSCSVPEPKQPSKRLFAEELRMAEKAFVDSTAKKGFYASVLDVASEEFVSFNKGDTVMSTFASIAERGKSRSGSKKFPKLTWSATKIDVSSAGDLGYTYGWFEHTIITQNNDTIVTHGLYYSIWKKIDGKWKLVVG